MSSRASAKKAAGGTVAAATSPAPGRTVAPPASPTPGKQEAHDVGSNFVAGGVEANPYFFALVLAAPFLSLLLAYVTSADMATRYPGLARSPIVGMAGGCISDLGACSRSILAAGFSVVPTWDALAFIGSFMGVALLLEALPGKVETGPETLTGHVPRYRDNGVLHCAVFTALFWAGSNLGVGRLYDFGVFYDVS